MAQPIVVMGAGAWGTALAILLARNGQPVWLWARDPQQINALSTARCNVRCLPDIPFPPALQLTSDLSHALALASAPAAPGILPHTTLVEPVAGALPCTAVAPGVLNPSLRSPATLVHPCTADVLVAVSSAGFRAVLEAVSVARQRNAPIRLAWATKGFEPGSGQLLHQVVADVLGDTLPTAVVSGPTFAHEVAADLPTAVTIASVNTEFAADLAERLHNNNFRAYTGNDVVGVEVGGAVKNVLAIAAGIADGLGFGANTRAALVTRGLTEMMRLGTALGGRRETLMGLAGLGDLVLTCTDNQSRNRRLGLALAQGKTLTEALAAIGQAVEGVQTSTEVLHLAQKLGIDMPITEQVYEVLHAGRSPRDAVNALLNREKKAEL